MIKVKQHFWILLFSSIISWGKLSAQDIQLVNAHQILHRVNSGGDTLFIVNFWATWCQPCVEELPLFDRSALPNNKYPYKILLVSLDFRNQLDTRLVPFIQKKHIREEVMLMTESNPNKWVDLIDSQWSGAIPATKFFQSGKTIFHEGELNSVLLNDYIKKISN